MLLSMIWRQTDLLNPIVSLYLIFILLLQRSNILNIHLFVNKNNQNKHTLHHISHCFRSIRWIGWSGLSIL